MAPLLGFALFVGVLVSIAAPVAQAATTSSTLNFQARLLNNLGGIVPDGNYNIDFKIYNADSTTGTVGACSGACVWEETRKNSNSQGVQVINGYYSVNLGSVTAFGSSINWDQQLWLTMNIGGTTTGASPTWDGEMQNAGHSIALTALPYSFVAGQLALTSGVHRGTLGFSTVANDPNILLPDASGTICLQAASTCGFESTTGTDFIQNQSAVVQTANFSISGTGTIATAVQVPLVQTADSAVANTAGITLRSGNETGSSLSSGSVTIKSGDAAGGTNSGSGNIVIDSGSKSGSGTTGSITIGASNARSITIGNTSQTGATTITGNNSNGGISIGSNITVSGSNTLTTGSGITTIGVGGITVNGGGSVAIQKGTDYSTTGPSNSAAFTGSLIRLTGASTQTINGITGTSDGRIITLVNAAGQAAVVSNQSSSAPTAAERIITGTGADISLSPDASLELKYDAATQRWRVISGVGGNSVTTIGTYASTNHYANGASISGNTLILGSADSTNPGLVDTSSQTFAGNKTFTGTLTVAPTTNIGSVVIKQTSAASPSNDIFNVQGTNGTSNFIQVTSTAANQGAVTIQSFGSNNLTLQAGSGTISLGNTTAVSSSGALSLASGGSGGLTLQAASGTVSLGTSTTLNANGALTLASGGSSDLTINSLSGTLKFGSNTTAVLFTNSGTASIDATSGQNLNLGTSNSAHTTTLGSTNASAATTIQGGSGITLSNNTSASGKFDVTGSVALKVATSDFTAVGVQNDITLPSDASLVRLNGASSQTITGIAGGRNGYVLTLVNAAAQSATIANNGDLGASTAGKLIITGTGADYVLPAGGSITLVYDSGASVWRLVSAASGVTTLGTYSSSNHYADGAQISGGTLTLGSADTTHPGLVDTSNQTFEGTKTFNDTLTANNTHGNAIANFLDNGTNVMSIGATGLVTLQPAVNLTNGQTALAQTLTAANATASGTVAGLTQSITVSNTVAGTTTGHNITISDSTALANTNYGINITLNGSNTSQKQIGVNASVNNGIGIVGNSSGTIPSGSYCAGQNINLSLGVCGGSTGSGGVGILGITTGAGSGISSVTGSGAVGFNVASGSAGNSYFGTQTNSAQSAAAAYTSYGLYSKASGGAGATVYGGYFDLGSSSATAGAALYVTNGTAAATILQLSDNATPVLTVADGGAATFENQANSATAFQVQNSSASAYINVNTTDGYVVNNGVGNLGNEIQNPSFESSGTTDATGWYTPSATQVLTNNNANAHSGNYELVVTGNSSTHAIYTKYYAVHPGDTVYTEAWVKNSAGAAGDAGFYIEYDDRNKASTTFTNADTGLPGTSYVKKTLTDTVPAGSYFLRLAASVKATATVGSFYFDDFYLKKVNEQAPLLITNGSATAFQVQNASAVTVLGVDGATGKIFSNIANGGSAIGFTLNTSNTFSSVGAKLLSIQNNSTEEFSVDKDGNIVNAGNINIGTGKQFQIGGTQIATTNLSDGAQIAMRNAANTFSSTNSFQVTNTNAFQVQDAAGSHTYIQADTNGGTLYLGNTQTGSTIQIGNSTGAAVTQTINIGSTNATASSASTISIGSSVGGTLTLQPGGGIIITAGALATADNTSYLCRNSANKIAGCNTTGTGVAFINGGNTLGSLSGSLASLGTNDANSLQIKTNNVGRATFDQSNNLYLGNADATGVNAGPNNFNIRGTGSSAAGTAGGDISLYGGAGASATTGSAGGNITINGGAAGGSGANNGGNVTLVAGAATSTGTQGSVIVKNSANSSGAFQVQTTGGSAVFSVSTSTPTVTVAGGTVFSSNTYTSGANSTITQSLVDNNTTISATATATSLTFTVPAPTTATTGRLLYIGNGGTNSFVLNIGSTSFTLTPGSAATLLYIGSGWTDAGIDASTLQLGYTNSVGSTTPEIKLDSTRQTLNIQDADSTVGADILDVNASNAGGGGLGTVVFGVGATGATKVHTTGSGSATAFIVQNANNANFITVDTTSGGNSVSLDSDTAAAGTIKIGNTGGHAQTVNIGITASNASNSTINIATNTNASATNIISIGSNGNTANSVTIEAGNTGAVNIGNSDVAHTFNIGNGGSTTTQTVNIGSNSSSSVVNLKANAGISLKTNSSTNNGTLVQSVTTNSTAAFQVQNSSNNSVFNVDTTSNFITLGSTSQALTATDGVKIYTSSSTNSAVDLMTPTDSSTNNMYYGANAGRAQFGYDGGNGAAAIKAASAKGFELQVNGSTTNVITVNSSGQTTFHTSSDSATGFVVQNSSNATVLAVDTSARQLRVLENGGSTNYALIYYDTGTSTANYTASSGTVAVGTGAGAITVTAGSGAAVNITANAASNWKTNTGTLTLQSGSGSSDFLILNSGGSGQVQISGTSVIKLGSTTADPTCVNGAIYYNTTTPQFRGCVNGTWQNLASLTPTLQSTYTASTGSTTPEIKLDSATHGGLDLQDADSSPINGILFAVRGTNAGGLGTSIFNVSDATSNLNVQIGSSSGHSTNPVVLVLDNYSNSGADPTSNINGSIYYNGTNGKFRCYENNAWKDCLSGFNTITKSSDQAATQSSTTFQNDNTLQFAVAASTSYVFSAWIPVDDSNTTADLKYTFTAPTGSTLQIMTVRPNAVSNATGTTTCYVTTSGNTCAETAINPTANFIKVDGYVITGGTAGNVNFQFAQNTSTAASFPVIKAGATLSWHTTN